MKTRQRDTLRKYLAQQGAVEILTELAYMLQDTGFDFNQRPGYGARGQHYERLARIVAGCADECRAQRDRDVAGWYSPPLAAQPQPEEVKP